jgi:hypothetical protein
MDTLILVIGLILASGAIVVGVAFYRGRFRLASVSTKDKIQFVLMRKKDPAQQDARNTPLKAESSGLKTSELPSLDEEKR